MPATLLVDDGEKAENDFYQIDFNNPYKSNLVWVSTPKKEVPVTPEQPASPQAPQAGTPVQEQAILPQTGEEASTGLLSVGIAMLLVSLGGLLGLKHHKQEKAD